MLNISWANRWTCILVMNVTTLRTFPGHTAMGAFDLTTGVTWFDDEFRRRVRNVPETGLWDVRPVEQTRRTWRIQEQSTMTWSEAASDAVAGRMFEVPQSRPGLQDYVFRAYIRVFRVFVMEKSCEFSVSPPTSIADSLISSCTRRS